MKKFIIIISIFLAVLALGVAKSWFTAEPVRPITPPTPQAEEHELPNRNTFTQEIVRQPQPAAWTAAELFSMAMQTLEPEPNIAAIFQNQLQQFGKEPYYAGAWQLKDGTSCPLLWVADNQQFSFGIQWTGPPEKIRQLAKDITRQLGEPTETEADSTGEKQYWLQKKYKNMDYFIGFTLTAADENATLDLNVHPQIYH